MVKYISSKHLELEKLPQNINISTISATCSLWTTLICNNKYEIVDNNINTLVPLPTNLDI